MRYVISCTWSHLAFNIHIITDTTTLNIHIITFCDLRRLDVCVCCNAGQCVAVCCSVLQCVAVCCSVLQCVAMRGTVMALRYVPGQSLQHTATHCNTLWWLWSACLSDTLQHNVSIYTTRLWYRDGGTVTATRCNTLQHTATRCNTLQHTATHCNTLSRFTLLDYDIVTVG